MPDVVWRLVEHRLTAFSVAGPAQDPEMTHAEAAAGALLRRGAEARFPSDELRRAQGQGVPERAALRTVGEQGNGHPMIMP